MTDSPLDHLPTQTLPERHRSAEAFDRWLTNIPADTLDDLLTFANRVQRWSLRGYLRRATRFGTFAQAAKGLDVPIERIADAVGAHYWMFTSDYDLPLAERHIDHEGE